MNQHSHPEATVARTNAAPALPAQTRRGDPQAAALNAFADVTNWTRLQARLRDIIARCDDVTARLRAFDKPGPNAHLRRVKAVHAKAKFVLNDRCTPAMAEYHIAFFGPAGRGDAMDYAIELGEKEADFHEALARCQRDTANARDMIARIDAADAPVHAAAKAALA